MEYSNSEQRIIKELIDEFQDEEITFVIPRGHAELPQSVPGGDIDVFIQSNDFELCIQKAKSKGFVQRVSESGGLINVLRNTIREPRKAINMLSSNRREVYSLLNDAIKGEYNPSSSNYHEWKGRNRNIIIHFMNHVAYKSPLTGEMIRVDPSVEKSLFENRKWINDVPIPDEPDELLHLICRGIYDKEGEFPEYYISRCESLSQTVFKSSKKAAKFKKLLSLVFFDADSLILDLTIKSRYNKMREELRKYPDY